MKTVTIEQAQEDLASLIEAARTGESIEITDQGVPVAVLEGVPPLKAIERLPPDARAAAWRALLDEIASRPALNLGKFDRAKLYDELLGDR
jgi:prevent-host-death family protein